MRYSFSGREVVALRIHNGMMRFKMQVPDSLFQYQYIDFMINILIFIFILEKLFLLTT